MHCDKHLIMHQVLYTLPLLFQVLCFWFVKVILVITILFILLVPHNFMSVPSFTGTPEPGHRRALARRTVTRICNLPLEKPMGKRDVT